MEVLVRKSFRGPRRSGVRSAAGHTRLARRPCRAQQILRLARRPYRAHQIAGGRGGCRKWGGPFRAGGGNGVLRSRDSGNGSGDRSLAWSCPFAESGELRNWRRRGPSTRSARSPRLRSGRAGSASWSDAENSRSCPFFGKGRCQVYGRGRRLGTPYKIEKKRDLFPLGRWLRTRAAQVGGEWHERCSR
jgi:hypothetical protein